MTSKVNTHTESVFSSIMNQLIYMDREKSSVKIKMVK